MDICPCRTLEEKKTSYDTCCQPILEKVSLAQTAEQLMRARYSAYATGKIEFISETQEDSANEFNVDEARKWASESTWQGLEVIRTLKGALDDTKGEVEFVAKYQDKKSGQDFEHREHAYFFKNKQGWIFKEGKILAQNPLKRSEPKVGRNDPCPCGSGKKFKKCCG